MHNLNEKQVKIIYQELGLSESSLPKKLMDREILLANHLVRHAQDENCKILMARIEDLEKQNNQLQLKQVNTSKEYENIITGNSIRLIAIGVFKNPLLLLIPVGLTLFLSGFFTSIACKHSQVQPSLSIVK